MSPSHDGTARLRPVRWMLPLGLGLLALASWVSASDGSAAAGTDGVPEASSGSTEADRDNADGPLAPQLHRDNDAEAATRAEARGEGVAHATAAAVRAERPRGPSGATEADPAFPLLPLLARHATLTLLTPASDPVLVGFHEAGTRDGLELSPVGVLIENNNTTRVSAPPDAPEGTPYQILHSRGRRAPATSAVDIAMRDDDPVLAPVDGTITDVREYYLGGRYLDVRVEIQPDLAPELRVVIIHVDRILAAEGDRVQAGRTMLAETARRLPFASQIDYAIADERWPHVHLEVKPAAATRPGDG